MKELSKRIDYGHLLLIIFIAGWVSWYFFDSYTASSNIQNLILIAPASILALVLCFIVSFEIFRSPISKSTDHGQISSSQSEALQGQDSASRRFSGITGLIARYRVLCFIILFGLYVTFLEIIGFDVATYLFIAVVMALQGERRIWVLLAYSIAFGTLAVLAFGLMIPYPMFTRLVPDL